MSLKDFNNEQLKNKAMLELARHILEDTNKALPFQEIYDQVAKLKGFTKKEKDANIAQFFTELNVDGRFMTPGSNTWGLKRWYPVDQADEEVTPAPKKKSKAAKKAEEEDELLLEPDDEVVELGEEVIEDDDDEDEEDDVIIDEVIDVDDDEEEVDEFEELDVEKEDLEEEITLDEDDEEDEDEKI